MVAPGGIAIDARGSIYVTDSARGMILKESPQGPGGYAQSVIGTGFNHPYGIAVDANGAVYVADTGNNQVLKETPATGGSYVRSVLASGLHLPFGIAQDAQGAVYVTAVGGNQLLKETPTGSGGFAPSLLDSALRVPLGVAVDSRGTVFVVEYGRHRLVMETRGSNGIYHRRAVPVDASRAYAVTVGADGTLALILDTGGIAVYRSSGQGAYVLRSTLGSTQVGHAAGAAFDANSAMVVADAENDRVVREVPNHSGGFSQTVVAAGLIPSGVAVDAAGTVYMTDQMSGRLLQIVAHRPQPVIRIIASGLRYPGAVTMNPATGVLYVLAEGEHSTGQADLILQESPRPDGSFRQTQIPLTAEPTAALLNPFTISADSTGIIYVANFLSVFTVVPNGLGGYTEHAAIPNTSPYQDIAVAAGEHGSFYLSEIPGLTGGAYRVVEAMPDHRGGYREQTIIPLTADANVLVHDSHGRIYISSTVGGRLLRETPNGHGGYRETILLQGISRLNAAAVDSKGTVYVADGDQHRILWIEGCEG